MDSGNGNTLVTVKHCSLCPGCTEYHCLTCGWDLCSSCKRIHNINWDSKHHKVLLYKYKKNNPFPKPEVCKSPPQQVYRKFCEHCDAPVCFIYTKQQPYNSITYCFRHTESTQHKLESIRKVHRCKKEQYDIVLNKIKSDTLYNAQMFGIWFSTVVKRDSKKYQYIQNSHQTAME